MNRLVLLLFVVFLTLPNTAFALGGSEEMWSTIFSVVIISFFGVFSLILFWINSFNKNGKKFWHVVNLILSLIGVTLAFLVSFGVFEYPEWLGMGLITFSLCSLPYFIILFRAINNLNIGREEEWE